MNLFAEPAINGTRKQLTELEDAKNADAALGLNYAWQQKDALSESGKP